MAKKPNQTPAPAPAVPTIADLREILRSHEVYVDGNLRTIANTGLENRAAFAQKCLQTAGDFLYEMEWGNAVSESFLERMALDVLAAVASGTAGSLLQILKRQRQIVKTKLELGTSTSSNPFANAASVVEREAQKKYLGKMMWWIAMLDDATGDIEVASWSNG